ncbi:MAG: hypothetical protein AB1486_31555 [Planctomycetota bacterium]
MIQVIAQLRIGRPSAICPPTTGRARPLGRVLRYGTQTLRPGLLWICILTGGGLGCGEQVHHYGEPISNAPVLDLQAVVREPSAYLDKTVTLRGEIVEVCPTSGCWCVLRQGNTTLFVDFAATQNLVLPPSATGCQALVQGVLRSRTTGLTLNGRGVVLR